MNMHIEPSDSTIPTFYLSIIKKAKQIETGKIRKGILAKLSIYGHNSLSWYTSRAKYNTASEKTKHFILLDDPWVKQKTEFVYTIAVPILIDKTVLFLEFVVSIIDPAKIDLIDNHEACIENILCRIFHVLEK